MSGKTFKLNKRKIEKTQQKISELLKGVMGVPEIAGRIENKDVYPYLLFNHPSALFAPPIPTTVAEQEAALETMQVAVKLARQLKDRQVHATVVAAEASADVERKKRDEEIRIVEEFEYKERKRIATEQKLKHLATVYAKKRNGGQA